MKFSLRKLLRIIDTSITRRLLLHTTIAVLFLLTFISITIWSSNTLTMITAITRFERTHTVSRIEAMVSLSKYLQFKDPVELDNFHTKMDVTQSYNKLFSQLLDMRNSTPDAEFIELLKSTFREADYQTAEIIVNRVKILYNHPIMIELVSLSAMGNTLGERIKELATQMVVAKNESEQRAIFAEIEKIEKEFIYLENSFSKGSSDLGIEVAAYVNYINIALLLLSIGFISLLTYLIAKALLRQVVTHTSNLEKEIHERNLVVDELRQSEITFRKLFEDSSDAILLIDGMGVFVECNQAALDLLKMSRQQFLLLAPADISPEFQPDGKRSAEIAPEMIALAYSKGLHRFDWTCINAEGGNFIVEVSLMPITIKGQNMLHTTWRDVTERKRVESERIQLEAQLQQVQKIESIGQLAGGVAHDFNNMLGVILGHVDLAMVKADPSSPFITNLEQIRKAAKRSTDLTKQLLTFARKQTAVPKVLDLTTTVAGMLQMLQRLIGENICLCWEPEENLWPVKVDPSQIDQILANLCVNARDAISGNGCITIELSNTSIDQHFCSKNLAAVPGDFVMLSINDDGIGMDKVVQAHMFDPFFTTKDVGKGTGLGLASVYGAVKQNNGFITYNSELGKGTTFNIYLPRVEMAFDVVPESAKKPLRRGTETILLVEDDEMLLELTTEILEGSGYKVLPAVLPNIALSLAELYSDPIHLLISDVIMPEMNGKDLSEQLLAQHPEMKVIFISGYTAEIISRQGFIDEGVAFLLKPVSQEALIAKVQEVLKIPIG